MMNKEVLFLLIIFIGTSNCFTSEKELYYLPDKFKGKVVIFFNQNDGAEKKYEGDYRVYEIPTNGILKTQFPPNDGKLYNPNENVIFLYKDKQEKIPVRWSNQSNLSSSENQVYLIQRGSSGNIQYTRFVIGQYNQKSQSENGWEANDSWNILIKQYNIN